MKYFQEVIDTYLNYYIVSDEIYDGKSVKDITDRATHITAANYLKAGLENVAYACTYLDKEGGNKLYLLLKIYSFLFNGTLIIFNTDPAKIIIK